MIGVNLGTPITPPVFVMNIIVLNNAVYLNEDNDFNVKIRRVKHLESTIQV